MVLPLACKSTCKKKWVCKQCTIAVWTFSNHNLSLTVVFPFHSFTGPTVEFINLKSLKYLTIVLNKNKNILKLMFQGVYLRD